jgi:hypothetical protein
MKKTGFTIAFKIEVSHSYFKNNICTCLQFELSAATKKIFDRFGCIIRNKINGFDFYVNATDDLAALFTYIKNVTAQDYFEFDIKNKNPSFNLFTELPADWVGQLTYDSSSGENNVAKDTVELKESLSINSGIASFGKLLIYFDDIIKYQNDKKYTQFNIAYKARATQWQYFIINRNAVVLDNPAIVGKVAVDFDTPEIVVTETGQQAILFSSGNNLIPLSEVPVYMFDLVNNSKTNNSSTTKKSTAAKIIFKGLPNPDPDKIGIIKGDIKNEFSSPMYVYV